MARMEGEFAICVMSCDWMIDDGVWLVKSNLVKARAGFWLAAYRLLWTFPYQTRYMVHAPLTLQLTSAHDSLPYPQTSTSCYSSGRLSSCWTGALSLHFFTSGWSGTSTVDGTDHLSIPRPIFAPSPNYLQMVSKSLLDLTLSLHQLHSILDSSEALI